MHRSSITSLPYEHLGSHSTGQELGANNIWADQLNYLDHKVTAAVNEEEADWMKDFEQDKKEQETANQEFNTQFWDRLHNEWKKISEEQENQHPWLSEFTEFYDPYKVSQSHMTRSVEYGFVICFRHISNRNMSSRKRIPC